MIKTKSHEKRNLNALALNKKLISILHLKGETSRDNISKTDNCLTANTKNCPASTNVPTGLNCKVQ